MMSNLYNIIRLKFIDFNFCVKYIVSQHDIYIYAPAKKNFIKNPNIHELLEMLRPVADELLALVVGGA
jgi:hypothetical protein